jgi:hypothetical protein
MRLAIQGRMLAAALAMIAVGLLAAKLARSEEPRERCELRVNAKIDGVPLLSRIPYVNRLFKTTHAPTECCNEVERIGIDFDFEAVPGQVIEFHAPIGVCPDVCPVCPLPGANKTAVNCASEGCPAVAFVTAAKCCADSKCCADGKCCAEGTCKCCAEGKCKCCSAECCQVAKDEKTELWEHVAELTAENAAMEATLEGHEALLEAKGEMFESLAELMVEKAKLEAKLEMVDHRDSMLKEMVELHAENAKLKAQAELAQQKEELLKSQLATVLENERLKQRVAELEHARGVEETPVVAEKKQLKSKKVR